MRKILSLILVIAMMVSFVVAVNFTDAPSINHTEAVDVLSTLAVIEGYPDGSFHPEGKVTRAEMAKMVAIIANKGEDVNDLYKGACPFADSTSHWAAGYIAYCAQEGIISGKSETTFDPEGEVTGVEAAKMLLCVLGYNADSEGFKGSTWATAVLSKAAAAGLVGKNHNLAIDMSVPMVREDVAQLMFNALQATMVYYENASTIVIGNVVVSNNANARKAGVDSDVYDNNSHNNIVRDELMQLAEVKFSDLRLSADSADNFNRLGNKWTYKGVIVGTYAQDATVKYSDTVVGGTVYTDLGKLKVTDYLVEYYTDGIADPVACDHFVMNVKSGNTEEIGAVGANLEIYVDEDARVIRIVQINYYVGTVAQVWNAQVDANGDISRDAYIKISPMIAAHNNAAAAELDNGTTAVAATVQTSAFTASDRDTVIVYTYSANTNTIESVARTTAVSGTQTGYGITNGEYIDVTVNGQTYSIAATFCDDNMFGLYGDVITLYLDPNGNVIYTEAEATNTYAYVMAAGNSGEFISDNVYKARLLFPDGTIRVVELRADYTALTNSIVNYAIRSDNKYELHPVVGNYETATNYTYRSGTVNLNGGAVYGNNNTVFVVETISNDISTYTVYTGIQSVPNITGAGANYYAFAKNGEAAPVVYLLGVDENDVDATVSANHNIVAFATGVDSLRTTATTQYYTVNAVVDGAVTALKVEASDRAYGRLTFGVPTIIRRVSMNNDNIVTNVVVEETYVATYNDFTKDNDGVYTGIYNNGVIEVTNGAVTAYSVNADTPVYVYNSTKKTTSATTMRAYYPETVTNVTIAFDNTKEVGNTTIVALYVIETSN